MSASKDRIEASSSSGEGDGVRRIASASFMLSWKARFTPSPAKGVCVRRMLG